MLPESTACPWLQLLQYYGLPSCIALTQIFILQQCAVAAAWLATLSSCSDEALLHHVRLQLTATIPTAVWYWNTALSITRTLLCRPDAPIQYKLYNSRSNDNMKIELKKVSHDVKLKTFCNFSRCLKKFKNSWLIYDSIALITL